MTWFNLGSGTTRRAKFGGFWLAAWVLATVGCSADPTGIERPADATTPEEDEANNTKPVDVANISAEDPVVDISAAMQGTCLTLQSGQNRCFGWSINGVMGRGPSTARTVGPASPLAMTVRRPSRSLAWPACSWGPDTAVP